MPTQTGHGGVHAVYAASDSAAGSARSDATAQKSPTFHRRPNACSSARLFPFPVDPPLLDSTRRRRAPSALRLGAAYEKRIPRSYRKFNLPVHPHYDDVDDIDEDKHSVGVDRAMETHRNARVGKVLLSDRNDYESLVRLHAVNYTSARCTSDDLAVRSGMDKGKRCPVPLRDHTPDTRSSSGSISPPQTAVTLGAASSLRASPDSITPGREPRLIYID